MTQSAISAEDLCKRYGKKIALADFRVDIPRGTVTAILGPNGAGKSTFMRMITGMVRPDRGTVTVFGRKPSWKTNASIAYLPDRARWFGGHTVRQAVEWGAKLLPGFQTDRAWELIDMLGLGADQEVAGMSKGQEARLMLAVCLARDVPLLVLDEPFSGIDMLSREKIVAALIDSFSERSQTVLISTHEIAETESLFDYAVFFAEGRNALSGDVEELRARRGSVQDIYRQLYG
jgi:ABC-2 type transport system ATP-binding protein